MEFFSLKLKFILSMLVFSFVVISCSCAIVCVDPKHRRCWRQAGRVLSGRLEPTRLLARMRTLLSVQEGARELQVFCFRVMPYRLSLHVQGKVLPHSFRALNQIIHIDDIQSGTAPEPASILYSSSHDRCLLGVYLVLENRCLY
ncbi:hypothetical protein V2J09_001499 [Rumex salicifolius]